MELCHDDLRQIPVFEELGGEELDWLLGHGGCLSLETGDVLWEDGEPADAMFVVLRGAIRIHVTLSGQSIQLSSHRWGGVIGVLPYSRMTQFPGQAVAAEPTRILRLAQARFPEMLQAIPELGYRLVALMADRVRDRTRAEQQREKMIALGKLSAGLAHELNNPAAAVQRTVSDLTQRLGRSNALVRKLAEHGLDGEQMRALVAVRENGAGHATAEMTALERGDREEALGEWLEELGVEDGWMMAEAFVDAGLEREPLEALAGRLPVAAVPDAFAWIESGLAARQLLGQVASAAGRIAELVRSVKSYSHMDQSPDKQPADLHRGLDETLALLGHRFQEKDVRLSRAYAELPDVPAYVSELNQVWTNLIDNAVDAMGDGGRLDISTEQDSCSVYVRITDDGTGIPDEARRRIFEPFFTTKEVGKGTGLGLDIAQRIVWQHEGELTFESRPGRTTFTVRLPKGASESRPR